MFELLSAAAAFGLSGGFSPGPLMALVVAQSLAQGTRAGIAIAVAPLVTDGPIVVASVLLLGRIQDSEAALGIVSLAGGALLASWGVAGLRDQSVEFKDVETGTDGLKALAKGIAANLLNPSPYLFWLAVGAPLLVRAAERGPGTAVVFLAMFYLALVGSKCLVAVLVARSRSILRGPAYLWANRILAVVLLIYAVIFVRAGLLHLVAG
jgi:threonine/homoserine/homoserine lactone efflux protein